MPGQTHAPRVPAPEPQAVASLQALARAQHGVVRVDAALRLGMTRPHLRTMVDRGHFTAPHRGVLVSSTAPETWSQQVSIALAATGGVASHRCAARVHGLDGFAAAPAELIVPPNGSRRPTDAVVHHSPLERGDVTRCDGLATTSIARTLVDLGAVVDDDLVEQALDDALRRGTSERWIRDTLERLSRPGPSGSGSLRRVIERPDRQGALPDSVFERLLDRLVRSAGLPPPERQVRVEHDGRVVAVLDCGWRDLMLALEADSEMWHFGPRRGRLARRRHNQLSSLGWTVLYAGWHDTRDPARLLEQLATIARRAIGP